MTRRKLHPLIVAAARGELPVWARVRTGRLTHLASVAELLTSWAAELGLDDSDRMRWVAAGWLHDSLRDEDPESLAAAAAHYPAQVQHGPAAAERLSAEGVDDRELLDAIRYHSLGHRGFGALGRYLYLADYLEPGRPYAPVENAAMRAALPHEPDAALRRVCARRIREVLNRGRPLRRETVAFWNELQRDGAADCGGET
ncbi:MAG: HD domain-containing protein [Gemmatimonadetes bacterium]|nr:HD domain-containing protein [Gemmatimonadota bacterium]NIO31152.1 HD domain-containing protein [Gemmatimonadota bacterium]